MTELSSLSESALGEIEQRLEAAYQDHCRRNYQLDMTRGNPASAQLDLSDEMLGILSPEDCNGSSGSGIDYRGYGVLTGIPEAKALFAELLELAPEEIIIGGNSSLALMYDAIVGAMLFGQPGGPGPWREVDGVSFLCPVPGYDRHFAICERLGIAMTNIEMTDEGPDMDQVEAAVADDPAVKAIWCVPKYSNPTGVTYTDRVVERLAAMPAAAPDFRILWDNAYAYHHLGGGPARVMNILDACKAAGRPERPLIFASTSKITYAGAGLAVIAGSTVNMADVEKRIFYSTIGHDKINQLRHVRFLKDKAGLAAQMDRLAALIAPKFDIVDRVLARELGGKGIAHWRKPGGGYFISLDIPDGCAADVVAMAAKAGVKLTPAGATFPYRKDPRDRNIRIAPTMPSVAELEQAVAVLAVCIELAAARKLRGQA